MGRDHRLLRGNRKQEDQTEKIIPRAVRGGGWVTRNVPGFVRAYHSKVRFKS